MTGGRREGGRKMFGFSSALTKRLNEWIKRGGDLDAALKYKDYPVRTKEEANSVIRAITYLRDSGTPSNESDFSSTFHSLAAFFQKVESREAFETLCKDGLPLLRLEVERVLAGEPAPDDTILFILKILAMYKQKEDVELISRVARANYEPGSYMWSVVFGIMGDDHPFAGQLVDALRNPLPKNFVAVAFLDLCNSLAIANKLHDHPFGTEEGISQLRVWLQSTDPSQYSYAHSATAALPFLPIGARSSLLKVASEHQDVGVRLEAAWASAKSGDQSGLHLLADYCRNPNHSSVAQRYLTELGAGDEIPEECRDPDFQAVAEMANWLSHPGEFGRPPTSIEVFDTRTLYWPPTGDSRQLWLVKYRYVEPGKDEDIGVGMVGSITFALFGEATAELSPEDIYGLHCSWEMQTNEDPKAPKETNAAVGRAILADRNTGF